MKRTLALAAVSMSQMAAAHAQSSVTIYGLVDQGVSRINKGLSSVNPTLSDALLGSRGVWTVKSSTSSRLGFRGSEDLGGGNKANFLIETRISPDTGGIQAGQVGFWGGQSWVGLSNAQFGELRLGRQFLPGHLIAVQGDPWGLDYNSAGGYGFVKGGSTVSYGGNSIDYRSPTLAGVTAEIQLALGEGGTSLNPSNTQPARNVGALLQYQLAPVYAAVAYNKLETGNSTDNRFWIVTGNYDFGVIKPYLTYARARINNNTDSISGLVGAVAPLGTGRLKAMWGYQNLAGPNNTTRKLGLGYEYFFSKRTSVHADVGVAKTGNLSRGTGYEAGIKHLF